MFKQIPIDARGNWAYRYHEVGDFQRELIYEIPISYGMGLAESPIGSVSFVGIVFIKP
jgi:hypothetical protein